VRYLSAGVPSLKNERYNQESNMGFFDKILGKRKDVVDEQWELPIVQEICIAMIHQIPEHWDKASIVLEVPEHGLGRGLAHSAITPEPSTDMALRSGDFVTPDTAVMAATRKLELGWVERKGTFKRAIITAAKDAEGGWDIRSAYEYDD
jgi:hypothetical protein